ncbi:LacI family transcriptional regulator [Achromobacter denitrificans]|uniref:Tripartite tricarboxylate transporter substrate binding protein n=1 Tax=Achromobacter denitrificans TaxID=32002 RepID=A0A6N0JSS2_ACHDE|nr:MULTISPECIES: tripartite tricarboxylate transporter substrate binding protein [Achromobacter]ASC64563.1 LacI family transcriptional regulator [Achromobacter denitrificans]MDF3862292.1 tripartite tricarboxylate transporter substrate binding protein [Achromobacter denitrificans]QKQ50252.1 tripartite tricarboxylate transporter substrate binding protein [Achromobacter denitrificans]
MEPRIRAEASCNPRRRRLLIGAAGATLGALGGGARAFAATGYPSKPLRVVIPYPPGGPTDIVGRIVATTLADKLGQSVVIDNRPGASGMIGADMVAKAAPDGYVLLINVSGQLVNPALYATMSHDPLRDFRGITNLASTPIQLVISANSPVRSVAELIELVRSQPGRHNFASSSNGTPGHLAGEVFKAAAKLDVTHIPYKGSAPALTDVVGGQVTYMLDSMPSSISLVKGGKLRALAVTSAQRVEALPDVPTFAELGYPDVNLTTWYGMWAPAQTPPDLIAALYKTVSGVLRQPDVRTRLADSQAMPVGDTPEQFDAYCRSEAKRYAEIVQRAGIRLQ